MPERKLPQGPSESLCGMGQFLCPVTLYMTDVCPNLTLLITLLLIELLPVTDGGTGYPAGSQLITTAIIFYLQFLSKQ